MIGYIIRDFFTGKNILKISLSTTFYIPQILVEAVSLISIAPSITCLLVIKKEVHLSWLHIFCNSIQKPDPSSRHFQFLLSILIVGGKKKN